MRLGAQKISEFRVRHPPEGRRQKAEGRRQKAEGRRQKAEGRRQRGSLRGALRVAPFEEEGARGPDQDDGPDQTGIDVEPSLAGQQEDDARDEKQWARQAAVKGTIRPSWRSIRWPSRRGTWPVTPHGADA